MHSGLPATGAPLLAPLHAALATLRDAAPATALERLVALRLDRLPLPGHGATLDANLGVSAAAYLAAGGFAPVDCHEDVLLVRALERIGARFAWSARPRVVTSASIDARARGGFGDTLRALTAGLLPRTAAP